MSTYFEFELSQNLQKTIKIEGFGAQFGVHCIADVSGLFGDILTNKIWKL
jgi:hypothetical protein